MRITTQLEEIERCAQDATPGPWIIEDDKTHIYSIRNARDEMVLSAVCFADDDNVVLMISRADAEFITTARTAIPQMVAWIRAMQARAELDGQIIADLTEMRKELIIEKEQLFGSTQYSDEMPTKPGKYWGRKDSHYTTCIIENCDAPMVIFPTNHAVVLVLAYKQGWRFAGPLQEAEENHADN